MARKRYAAEQIVDILREVERAPSTDEGLRKHGISAQTFYRWKRMDGGVGVVEVQRMKHLESENRQLKQLVGDQALALQVLHEDLKKRARR